MSWIKDSNMVFTCIGREISVNCTIHDSKWLCINIKKRFAEIKARFSLKPLRNKMILDLIPAIKTHSL